MAKKGDILTDFVTAPWYNKVNKAIDLRTGLGTTHSPVIITVYNHSTTPRKVWEPVSLGTSKIDYTDYPNVNYNNIAFNTKALSSSDPHNIAILQQPLEGIVGASADAMLVGATWLRMPEAQATDTYIWIGSGNVLEYYNAGRVNSIRDFEVDAGVEWLALVVIGPLSQRGIIDIRVSGFDLQYTFNGTDWETWHTGTDCPTSS